MTTFDINRLQHFFFDGRSTLEAWQTLDRWLGRLVPQFDYTLILSDHGTEPVRKAYFLNVWLRQKGYLHTRFHPMDILPRLGINRSRVGRLVQGLGLTRLFSYETLVRYGSMLPQATGGFGMRQSVCRQPGGLEPHGSLPAPGAHLHKPRPGARRPGLRAAAR